MLIFTRLKIISEYVFLAKKWKNKISLKFFCPGTFMIKPVPNYDFAMLLKSVMRGPSSSDVYVLFSTIILLS